MIIKTQEQFDTFFYKIQDLEIFALDTETEKFTKEKDQPQDLKMDGFGIYGKDVKGYISWEIIKDNIPELQTIIDKVPVIFHNAKFDLKILKCHGFDVENIFYHDTMIMSWLLDENRYSHALKELAKTVLKVNKESVVKFGDVMERPVLEEYGLFPDEYYKDILIWEKQLGNYCIDDCKYTFKLFELFKTKMEEQDLWSVYTKLELPVIKVLMDMEMRGITMNTEYLKEIGGKMEKQLIQLQATIWKDVGREFKITSAKQLGVVLYTDRGYTLTDEFKTPKGAFSTNVHALNYLGREHPEDTLIQNILKYREISKLHSTYIVGLLAKQREGVIHPSFRQQGTVTGRLSCSNPNLQQIPRREDEYNIRKAFIPRKGYVFVICDLSQIELRVAAFLCKDPTLVRAFKEGKDVHQETADVMNVERVVAKTINFGVLYGRSPYGMAKQLGITTQKGEAFIKQYFTKFKRLEVLIQQAKNTMKKHGSVRTLLKRKRRFPDYAKAKRENDWREVAGMERQTLNAIVQGSAADIVKLQMRNMVKDLKKYDAHILVQIHDEVIVEVPEEHSEKVMEVVQFHMENAPNLGEIPLIAEPFISNCWKK